MVFNSTVNYMDYALLSAVQQRILHCNPRPFFYNLQIRKKKVSSFVPVNCTTPMHH